MLGEKPATVSGPDWEEEEEEEWGREEGEGEQVRV